MLVKTYDFPYPRDCDTSLDDSNSTFHRALATYKCPIRVSNSVDLPGCSIFGRCIPNSSGATVGLTLFEGWTTLMPNCPHSPGCDLNINVQYDGGGCLSPNSIKLPCDQFAGSVVLECLDGEESTFPVPPYAHVYLSSSTVFCQRLMAHCSQYVFS